MDNTKEELSTINLKRKSNDINNSNNSNNINHE